MGVFKYQRHDRYHDPYANLAHAILVANKRDKAFMQSEWADELRAMCEFDDAMYGCKDNIIYTPRQVSNGSKEDWM